MQSVALLRSEVFADAKVKLLAELRSEVARKARSEVARKARSEASRFTHSEVKLARANPSLAPLAAQTSLSAG